MQKAVCCSAGITAEYALQKSLSAMCSAVSFRDRFPQLAAGHFAATADHVGDELMGAATQGNPDPLLMRLLQHESPAFIQF